MNIERSKSGFSLIELLTVIAIIAILAAVIFPVMNSVKNNAKKTQCISNLHSIQSAIKMYKLDNRKYPPHLGPVKYDAELGINLGSGVKFEDIKDQDCLYPEYLKTATAFKCPNVGTTVTTQTMPVQNPVSGETPVFFEYNSYDAQKINPMDEEGELRYAVVWAADINAVGNYQSAGNSNEQDFMRQLRWKNPPEDTVITWCSYHLRAGPNCLVLFLDGHVDQIPGNRMNSSKWRAVPKT